MQIIKATILLTAIALFACPSTLFACHYGSGYGSMYGNTGHFTDGMRGEKNTRMLSG